MQNQFGYEQSAPNAPWSQRDLMNKCSGCGNCFVGSAREMCSDCLDKAEVDDEQPGD